MVSRAQVKFLGEGVNDYGGPYRAVFEQIVDELQDDRLPLSQRPGEKCLLPLLVPCPNRMGAVGPNQDKFVLNPGPSSPLALELMQFLGKIVGMALRHGLPMGLDLPATVWRPLVGQPLMRACLESYDLLAVRTLQQVESTGNEADALASTPRGDKSLVPEGWEDLMFTTHLSDGSVLNLLGPAAGGTTADAGEVRHESVARPPPAGPRLITEAEPVLAQTCRRSNRHPPVECSPAHQACLCWCRCG
jgi:hypothetical protein